MVNCRSEPRIAEAIASVRADSPAARLEVFALDLFKVEASIRNRSNGFRRQMFLVNNLGIYRPKPFEEINLGRSIGHHQNELSSGVRLRLTTSTGESLGGSDFISRIRCMSGEMIHYGVTNDANGARPDHGRDW
jgi:hypothetical protein